MRKTNQRFFLCLRNDGYAASLQPRAVYEGLDDASAEAHGMLGIVDESGEDYLFPASLFVPIDASERADQVPPTSYELNGRLRSEARDG